MAWIGGFIIAPIIVGITVELLKPSTRSPEEKQIHELVLFAKGKKLSGQDCISLINKTGNQLAFLNLLSKASTQEQPILNLYNQCFQRQQESYNKIGGVEILASTIFETKSFFMLWQMKDRIPVVDEFVKSFYPDKYSIAQKVINEFNKKYEFGKNEIMTFTSRMSRLCPPRGAGSCKEITSEYNNYLTAMRGKYEGPFSGDFFDFETNKCITKCGNRLIQSD